MPCTNSYGMPNIILSLCARFIISNNSSSIFPVAWLSESFSYLFSISSTRFRIFFRFSLSQFVYILSCLTGNRLFLLDVLYFHMNASAAFVVLDFHRLHYILALISA
ncbi:hypothetical protein WCLE_011080 [Wolbachia endosymbiont of Cimex lectularius]|nr:hypothetical protein WCLE_011080 [Wolbachia endosymbiont of Cimex lectularius]